MSSMIEAFNGEELKYLIKVHKSKRLFHKMMNNLFEYNNSWIFSDYLWQKLFAFRCLIDLWAELCYFDKVETVFGTTLEDIFEVLNDCLSYHKTVAVGSY